MYLGIKFKLGSELLISKSILNKKFINTNYAISTQT